MEKVQLSPLGATILDSTIEIYRQYGPGLLESCYHFALEQELRYRGLNVSSQVPIDFSHRDSHKHRAFIIDLLVENEVIIEIKSVDFLAGIHTAQLMTYLKLTGKKLGCLITFNEVLVKNGFKRIVKNY